MLLVTPASYLTLSQLQSDATLDLTDRNGNAISTTTLNDLLEETAGEIDATIKQSFLPTEQTLRFHGDGSNRLYLRHYPIIYVKQAKIVLPNSAGFEIPIQSLLVDYEAGIIENQTPLTFQGIGVTTLFPKGIPIDVTFAYGVNYAIPAPTFTVTDNHALPAAGSDTPIAAGAHQVQVSSVTFNGESLPSTAFNITATAPTTFTVSITDWPGAMKYYIYLDGVLAGEILSQLLGSGQQTCIIDGSPPAIAVAYNTSGQRKTPVSVDGTPYPLQGKFAGLRRAQKFLIQQVIWELKNPSNQGIAGQSSGPKSIRFRDNSKSVYANRLDSLLSSLVYQGIM